MPVTTRDVPDTTALVPSWTAAVPALDAEGDSRVPTTSAVTSLRAGRRLVVGVLRLPTHAPRYLSCGCRPR